MTADRNSIITLPHEDLRKRSEKIHVITDEVKRVIHDMKSAALDWEDSRPHEIAVALAAVQIDELLRIVIVRGDFDNKEDRDFIALINPEVVKAEGEMLTEHEGCLSVKDVYGLVPRYSKIRVKALDEEGREVRMKVEGFTARVLQHEIDHTNGVMFVDHIDQDNEAFFTLTEKGDLEHLPYEAVSTSGIFRV
jgi:peptide deformylase